MSPGAQRSPAKDRLPMRVLSQHALPPSPSSTTIGTPIMHRAGLLKKHLIKRIAMVDSIDNSRLSVIKVYSNERDDDERV